MLPVLISWMPNRQRNRLLLPLPDGPMMALRLPSGKSASISSTIGRSPMRAPDS